jgi:hypothetical protein
MKRIIIHWTAGAHNPSNLDREHYHKIIDGSGKVHDGKFQISANAKPVKGQYAAHTLNCNTGSIGVAVAAMAGAQERPFNGGSHPITGAQVKALAVLCADLARQYKIPVTRLTVLTHAEVQPSLGIKQRGKWDITWLPGMNAPADPVAVGDKLRAMIAAHVEEKPETVTRPAPRVNETPVKGGTSTTPPKPRLGIGGIVAALIATLTLALSQWWEQITQIFGG